MGFCPNKKMPAALAILLMSVTRSICATRFLCQHHSRGSRLVDACKNKRYMINFLDESSSDQD